METRTSASSSAPNDSRRQMIMTDSKSTITIAMLLLISCANGCSDDNADSANGPGSATSPLYRYLSA